MSAAPSADHKEGGKCWPLQKGAAEKPTRMAGLGMPHPGEAGEPGPQGI